MPQMIVLHPDGRRETRDLPTRSRERLRAMQDAVGGYVELLSPAFHGLDGYDVWTNEEGEGILPRNVQGCRAIGFDLGSFRALCGPILLTPRSRGSGKARAAAEAFFARLERGEVPGYAFVIDAR